MRFMPPPKQRERGGEIMTEIFLLATLLEVAKWIGVAIGASAGAVGVILLVLLIAMDTPPGRVR